MVNGVKWTEHGSLRARRPPSGLGPGRCARVIAVLFVIAWLGAACSSPELSLEERARALDRQLMCPVCPGSTIDQSSTQVSKEMRRLVREKLEAGESEHQIKDYFVGRYGLFILAAPPRAGFNILVWAIPGVVLTAGAAAAVLILRAMRRPARVRQVRGCDGARNLQPSDAHLARFLHLVDADLERTSDRGRDDGKDDS